MRICTTIADPPTGGVRHHVAIVDAMCAAVFIPLFAARRVSVTEVHLRVIDRATGATTQRAVASSLVDTIMVFPTTNTG